MKLPSQTQATPPPNWQTRLCPGSLTQGTAHFEPAAIAEARTRRSRIGTTRSPGPGEKRRRGGDTPCDHESPDTNCLLLAHPTNPDVICLDSSVVRQT